MNESPPTRGSGELTVSVGGTTIVATDAVLAEADLMREFQSKASDWRSQIERIRQMNPAGPMQLNPEDPNMTLVWASVATGDLEQRTGDLAQSLMVAAEHYGWSERTAMQLAVLGSAMFGHELGQLRIPALLLGAGPAIQALVVWRAWNSRFNSGSATNYHYLTNPAVVALARLLVSSLDDVAAGSLGVPLSLDLLLGDTGWGVTGVSTTAAAVLAAARSRGFFREGPVSVARVGRSDSSKPPQGVADLAARIPKAVAGKPQVRIENYGDAEHPSWAVYISGTVEWDAVASTEPWDLTANVAAMAGQNAGSFEAVMQSMHDAGIGGDDPVVITGHSQGGLVATQVAASEAFNVQAVATFGAPETAVPVPDGVATLTVEHTDDIVTATGGASLVDSDDRLTVRREAFASKPLPAGEALPAHHLDTYRETAEMIDASPQENLQGFRDTVTGVLGSAAGGAALWRGIRVPDEPAAQ